MYPQFLLPYDMVQNTLEEVIQSKLIELKYHHTQVKAKPEFQTNATEQGELSKVLETVGAEKAFVASSEVMKENDMLKEKLQELQDIVDKQARLLDLSMTSQINLEDMKSIMVPE
jgi:hypothetical protein